MTPGVGAWLAHPTNQALDDLWLEVAKGGVQVVAVGVLGGALGYAWKYLATEREKEGERRAKIRAELVDLFGLYNDVKSVRRSLRSLGLDLGSLPLPKQGVRRGRWFARSRWRAYRFTDRQAQGFHEQMLTLNTLQLGFESKKRQFSQTDFLRKDTARVVNLLNVIETYLNDVLRKAWEKRAWTVAAGAEIKPVSCALQGLFRKSDFRANATEPLNEITLLINKHVFGKASAETIAELRKQAEKDMEEEAKLEAGSSSGEDDPVKD